MGSRVICLSVLLFFIAPQAIAAQEAPKNAPAWDIAEWINSPRLNLDTLKGRVVIIDFFQLWCPGCNSFSIPLLKTWKKTFAKEITEKRLIVISIHTVFEGHRYQTTKRLRTFLKEKGITHPVGVDRHVKNARLPETMKRYATRGTPEMAFIDKAGKIRFQKFGFFEPKVAENLLRRLLAE